MFSKIIFVLATVCVINASVVTVNVFDDDPETEVAGNPKSCNYQACDQLCRRLKFPGGTCVNGRCKCDNFRQAEEPVPEESVSDLEDFSLNDDPEIEGAASPKRCNIRACDQLCRRFRYPGGTCVNGRCKCNTRNFLNAEGRSFYLDDPDTECDLVCRICNYTTGACVDGCCKCGKSSKAEDGPETEVATDPKSCDLRSCEQLCRRLGFRGGACVRGRCKCDNFLNTEEAMVDPTEALSLSSLLNTEDADSVSPRKCSHQECNALCRKLKFREGVCIAGRCRCNNYFPNAKGDTVISEDDVLNDTSLGIEDEVLENSLPVSELSEEQTERGCNMRACDQLCGRLKFPGGACVNGRCKCDNFFGTEDAVDEYSELATRRGCNLRNCYAICYRRGYKNARCINGVCKCYNRIPGDLPLLNDETNGEHVDSNLIVRTDEEEAIVPSPRACNTVNCNQMCHRLNYAGGWCRGGVCQCY